MSDEAFRSPVDESQSEEALGDPRPPMLGMIAGIASMMAGLVGGTGWLQMFSMLVIAVWWARPIPWLLLGISAMQIVCGGATFTARAWAVLGATTFGFLGFIAWLLWSGFTLFNGLFSPAFFLAFLMSGLSGLLSAAAVVPVLRAARARRALYVS